MQEDTGKFIELLPDGEYLLSVMQREKHGFEKDRDILHLPVKKSKIEFMIKHMNFDASFYIHPNPRDPYKASVKMNKALANNYPNYVYLPKEFASAMASTSNREAIRWMVFDVDTEITVEQFDTLGLLGEYHAIQTKHGYHLLFDTSVDHAKVRSIVTVDQTANVMCPIPGTKQFDWTVKFLF